MKKIAIIGAGDFQLPLIKKAGELGFETHVFAWQDGAVGARYADCFYPISITEKEEILDKCREIKPQAVVSVASDLAVHTVNYVAGKLGLICNSDRNSGISTNKYQMRTAFRENDIPTPEFHSVGIGDALRGIRKMTLPVIVKPTDRSGSRAITKLDSFDGLSKAVHEAIESSFEKRAVIEEYIEGKEYSCECISFNGKHHMLALTEKFTTGAPHFIETGHIQPAPIPAEAAERIKRNVFRALDVLDVKYGASHTEFKLTPNGEMRIIETGSRMGGDCIGSHLVQLSTGIDFLKAVIDVACGSPPDLSPVCRPAVAAIRFIFSQSDAKRLKKLRESYSDKLHFVSINESDMAKSVSDSSSRHGYYILTCSSHEEAVKLGDLSDTGTENRILT